MTIQANIPDVLIRQAADVAKREGTSVDSIIATALSSQVTAWQLRDTVEQRAQRGRLSDLGRHPRRRDGCGSGGWGFEVIQEMNGTSFYYSLTKRVLLSLFIVSAATSALGQAFKEDISDVKIYPNTVGSITPIGDLGDIEKIVDHRGFFPYSLMDNKKSSLSDSGYSWFKVALIPAIAQAYYLNPYANVTELRIFKRDRDEQDKLYATNTAKHKVLCEKLAKVPVQKEDSLDDESKKWAKLAYNLSNERGKDVYDKIGAGVLETFVGCEPVCILFTSQSAFVFLNFRCNGLGREGVGQILVAMEFSRHLGDYKSYYLIYTNMLRRSTADTFSSTSSVVVPVAKILLDLNGAVSSKK